MSKPYGLVVCGGQSTRMGTDKSMIKYHGQPQRYHLYHMLEPLCERVFISCNAEQAAGIPANYAVIQDKEPYKGIGPMAALLSAHEAYPDRSFLVIGCDYVYICTIELQRLIKVSLQHNSTYSLASSTSNIREPLLSHYQPNTLIYLHNNFRQKNHSIRMQLDGLNTEILFPIDENVLESIDNVYDSEIAMKALRNE